MRGVDNWIVLIALSNKSVTDMASHLRLGFALKPDPDPKSQSVIFIRDIVIQRKIKLRPRCQMQMVSDGNRQLPLAVGQIEISQKRKDPTELGVSAAETHRQETGHFPYMVNMVTNPPLGLTTMIGKDGRSNSIHMSEVSNLLKTILYSRAID
ncbi:hypothetical protein HZ326_10859 [Fusarium oxysporum f. sp. albedinis]|nr:hypothetical protein HZ326_10859 [Fusarium oxysporum f. sp. albedinis]